MTPRSAIALCALVVGLSGLTVCQPPQPRIAVVEGRASESVASTGSRAGNVLAAFDRAEEATRICHPGGLLILSSKHNSRHELGDAETRRIGDRSARAVFPRTRQT